MIHFVDLRHVGIPGVRFGFWGIRIESLYQFNGKVGLESVDDFRSTFKDLDPVCKEAMIVAFEDNIPDWAFEPPVEGETFEVVNSSELEDMIRSSTLEKIRAGDGQAVVTSVEVFDPPRKPDES